MSGPVSPCTVEIWRNRVIGLTGPVSRTLSGMSRLLGGPFWHLYLVARFGDEHPGGQDFARYEIYEPSKVGTSRMLGGFLHRRFHEPSADAEWGTELVWRRSYACPSSECRALDEARVARYRWRDHYPRFWNNLRGTHVNSNSFVEKLVEEVGLSNEDGSAIDLTTSGRAHHPGLGLCAGWEFAHEGDTDELHAQWRRIHGGWVRPRYVRRGPG